ncbi:MAG: tRNA uridine-5-carboxymethylaminomethyl(34) synthesis GTPase MnmE [Proteobacteria bacterium]|nr:tRNA uridine-5-carboxymethylaminomethyl(34) synthesis GTPase MnmE [Pseudomonadota bacterium]
MIAGRRDTIAAIATPAGSGGIGIVRVSGPQASHVVAAILDRSPDSFLDRHLVLGIARDHEGRRLDEILAVVMRAPASYTGEDVAEIHGHGGIMNMSRLLRAAIEAGARHAEAGEFTRRAFQNGKLDLIRAEAISDVIAASSERAWRLAQAQLDGSLGSKVTSLRAQATELLAEVEACIDFPEEGEPYLDNSAVAEKATLLADEISLLSNTFTLGKVLREGIEVAISGPVNSGKSSIFNRLIDRERAIVDSLPGTTRDFVEASVVWSGIQVTLIDTAGTRKAESRVELQGIELGRKRAAEADVLLHVHSAEEPIPRSLPVTGGPQMELHIVTKGDLLDRAETPLLLTSAKTGEGVEQLRQAILDAVCTRDTEANDGHIVTSERQRALLEAAAAGFRQAYQAFAAHAPVEIMALEIREATQRLAEVMGERVGEEVLDQLFGRFCIGK